MANHNFDVAIIGAGIFGLWAARHAIKRGETIVVLEQAQAGAGASGGFLGALMPHMPDRWNDKKQRQFEALDSLSQAIEELQSDTGIDCGYRQCGRLMPMQHEKMKLHIERRVEGSAQHWQDKYSLRHLNAPINDHKLCDGWLSSDMAKFGATFDTLSARVDPRKYIKALKQFTANNGQLLEGAEVISIDKEDCSLFFKNGDKISAGRIIVANGYQAYPLLADIDARFANQLITGRGVKGQAVLVEFDHGDDLPIIYDNGSYIVPHADNLVAIGSTTLNDWADPTAFDTSDMSFYEHALKLTSILANAPIKERWASVRPRNTLIDPLTGKVGTEPIVGPIEGFERISMAIGGFKVGLAMAHYLNK